MAGSLLSHQRLERTGISLVRAGVPMLAGTDVAPAFLQIGLLPGFALHAELAMYVAEGLTPREALQTATLNPARLLRVTDSLGAVAPGKLADLVLLDADPLANIANTTTIRAVVANSRYFDRAALDRVLAEARVNFKTKVKEVGLLDYRWSNRTTALYRAPYGISRQRNESRAWRCLRAGAQSQPDKGAVPIWS